MCAYNFPTIILISTYIFYLDLAVRTKYIRNKSMCICMLLFSYMYKYPYILYIYIVANYYSETLNNFLNI